VGFAEQSHDLHLGTAVTDLRNSGGGVAVTRADLAHVAARTEIMP